MDHNSKNINHDRKNNQHHWTRCIFVNVRQHEYANNFSILWLGAERVDRWKGVRLSDITVSGHEEAPSRLEEKEQAHQQIKSCSSYFKQIPISTKTYFLFIEQDCSRTIAHTFFCGKTQEWTRTLKKHTENTNCPAGPKLGISNLQVEILFGDERDEEKIMISKLQERHVKLRILESRHIAISTSRAQRNVCRIACAVHSDMNEGLAFSLTQIPPRCIKD